MKVYTVQILCALVLSSLSGCIVESAGVDRTTTGYRPVYGSSELKEIAVTAPRPVKNPGKIYVYKHYLLVNEINEGIHVFDNSAPENPNPVSFLRIVGNSDMAIKGDILYADHLGNLIAVAISDFTKINKLGSLPLQNWNLGIPPPAGSYFECVDPEKGLVVSWKKTELRNPDCYANN